jgi:hypothetical protein
MENHNRLSLFPCCWARSSISCCTDSDWPLTGEHRELYRLYGKSVASVDPAAWACARESVHIYGGTRADVRARTRVRIILTNLKKHIQLYMSFIQALRSRSGLQSNMLPWRAWRISLLHVRRRQVVKLVVRCIRSALCPQGLAPRVRHDGSTDPFL